MYESLTRTRSGPACVPLARGKGPVLARVGGSAGKPVPASQRAKTSIPIHPRGLSAGRADPFVPGGRPTAYRLALTVKGSGYGPGKPDPIARVLHPRSDNTRCCPADSSWACPPGSRRIDVYSYKVPARPETKSALQGRGTGLARWWGHEVLKGPNTLAGVRSHFPGIQQRKLQTLRPCSYPYTPLLSAGPAKYRLSPMPPPPSLRMVPRPSQGGLWDRSYHQFSTAAKYPMGLLLGP